MFNQFCRTQADLMNSKTFGSGAPGAIRTPDPQIRRLTPPTQHCTYNINVLTIGYSSTFSVSAYLLSGCYAVVSDISNGRFGRVAR